MRPLYEAMKGKPRLPWIPQNIGHARVVGYLLRKAANRKWKQSKRKECVLVSRTERSLRPEEHVALRHGDTEFRICPAGFQDYFGPVFSHYTSFPPFWNGNIQLCLYMLKIGDFCLFNYFYFIGDYS